MSLSDKLAALKEVGDHIIIDALEGGLRMYPNGSNGEKFQAWVDRKRQMLQMRVTNRTRLRADVKEMKFTSEAFPLLLGRDGTLIKPVKIVRLE